jgi:predicted enzyme related to lactoylglutathione lyase
MSDSNVGRFVWHELMTTDTKAAIAFYSEIIGWKTQAWEEGNYTMWLTSQGTMGGVNPLPDQARTTGAPPHWTSDVQVADVDATVLKAKNLGAQVYVPPSDIPKIGRFSVFADPQGAKIAVYRPLGDMKLHDATKQGEFCWSELVAADHAAAFKFYSEVFGWEKLGEHDMGPMGKYLLFGKGATQYGGMFTKTKDMQMPPAWLYYIQVDDLDAALGRVKAMGGKVLQGPVTVPTGARIAQLTDPQGAAFALHELAKK